MSSISPAFSRLIHPKDFFFEAMNYLYYYNVHRRHSSLGRLPPYSYLSKSVTGLDDKIKFIPPIFLDYLAVQLGDWCGYHLLASHLFFFVRVSRVLLWVPVLNPSLMFCVWSNTHLSGDEQ